MKVFKKKGIIMPQFNVGILEEREVLLSFKPVYYTVAESNGLLSAVKLNENYRRAEFYKEDDKLRLKIESDNARCVMEDFTDKDILYIHKGSIYVVLDNLDYIKRFEASVLDGSLVPWDGHDANQ